MNLFTPSQYSESLARFQKVIDLLRKGKLDQSNAFDNRIIDEINTLYASPQVTLPGHGNLWQKYSVAIDSIGAIYGYCVDNLQNDVISFLQGLCLTVPLPLHLIKPYTKISKFRESTLHLDIGIDARLEIIATRDQAMYFWYLFTLANNGKLAFGFLNCLQVDKNLDLKISDDDYREQNCEIDQPINYSDLIDFTIEDLQKLDIFPIEIEKVPENPQTFYEIHSNHSIDDSIPSESPEINNCTLENRLDQIIFFDDFRFSTETNEAIDDFRKNKRRKKRNRRLDRKNLHSIQISELDVQEEFANAENNFSVDTINCNSCPAVEKIDEKYSDSIFFQLITRPLTKVKLCGNIEEVQESLGESGSFNFADGNSRLVEDEKGRELLNKVGVLNISQIKKKILEFMNIENFSEYELNVLKKNTAQDVPSGLFFVSILHLCNDHGFHLE